MACPSSLAAADLTLARSVTSNPMTRILWSDVSANRRSSEAERITPCRVNLPTLGRILSCELKPESAIGTCDQSAWHRMLHWSPMLTSPALVLL